MPFHMYNGAQTEDLFNKYNLLYYNVSAFKILKSKTCNIHHVP